MGPDSSACGLVKMLHSSTSAVHRKIGIKKGGREGRGKGREEGRDPEPHFEKEAKRRDLSIGSS